MTELTVHDFERPPRAFVDRFAAVQTADIANALGAAVIADPGLRPVWPFMRLFGTVLTVRLPPGDNFGAVVAPRFAQPGDVLVVDCGGGDTAVVGSLIARAASHHGVAGAIVDGAVRDVQDLEGLRFPVTSRMISPRRSTKARDAEIGGPIRCGGVAVQAGDIVVADRDGVGFVSRVDVASAIDRIALEQATEAEAGEISILLDRFDSTLRAARITRVR